MNEQPTSNDSQHTASVNVELSDDEQLLFNRVTADEEVSRIVQNRDKYGSPNEYEIDLIDAVARALRRHAHGARALDLLVKFMRKLLPSPRHNIEQLSFTALQRAGDPALGDYNDLAHWQSIRERAMDILQHGDPVEFIVRSCSRFIVNAESAIKKLLSCAAAQTVRQTSGLHPKLSGGSGGGKTHTVLTFANHMPREAIIAGSMSSLSVFYHGVPDRSIIIIDDYREGNETLDTVIKQTSSMFHRRYQHRTVVKQMPVTLEVGSELMWVITSVDASADIQVLNRQLPINIDDTPDATMRANELTLQRYGEGREAFEVDDDVLVCREMFRFLREEMIDVRIPFWDRILWLDNSNRRNINIFLDVLVAHTAIYHYQRARDADGYYLADESDFHAARELLFSNDKEANELLKRFSSSERKVLEFMMQHPAGVSTNDIVEGLDLARQRVDAIMKGKNGKGGLLQKVPIVVEKETVYDESCSTRRSKRVTYYRLASCNPLPLGDVVVLKPASKIASGQTMQHDATLMQPQCNP